MAPLNRLGQEGLQSVCPTAYRLHRNIDGLNLILEYACIQLVTAAKKTT